MSTQLESTLAIENHKLVSDPVSFESDLQLVQWLESQATEYHLDYLLAHADDGVIWGRFDQGKLTTADQIPFSNIELPALRQMTLHQCWVFGQAGEVFLWSEGEAWRSRHISNEWEKSYLNKNNYIEEDQLLWGTQATQQGNFTLLQDGSQGLKHAVPTTDRIAIDATDGKKLAKPVRLTVRHYIDYDTEDGMARIFLSRLVDFQSQSSSHKDT